MFEIRDWLLLISLIGGLCGIIDFIYLFGERIMKLVFPIKIEIEPLVPTRPAWSVSRTVEASHNKQYRWDVFFLNFKVINKGTWLTNEKFNWFTGDVIKRV